ncbi:protein FAM210B, mitochondrial [Kryptolebias marmoratus]|uniref:Family with sequence similarity 210 member B n=1 Tax=Kryptolebias marmoratus TaxID=37003 RepID=A0A3Q3B045_KRYMA|nr:protein FAM210B, mitochondrial [Kryptolebias marmoratus]
MLLCRSARPSAAAFRAPGSFLLRVGPSGPGGPGRDAALTLRRHRASCGPKQRAHPGAQNPEPPGVPHRHPAGTGLVTARWGHLNRVSAVAARLADFDATRPGSRGGTKKKSVMLTGNTSSMQTRAVSTKTATKKSEEQADGDKGFAPDLQEASTTSTTEKSLGDKPEPEERKLNKTQQLKKVFKEYGAVGVSFHIGISLMSLGMFYVLISSGIDMAAILCKLGFSEAVVQSKMAAGTSTFVLAYAIHKLFAPVRISITLVSVPLIVRYFRKTGLFKPPTPEP